MVDPITIATVITGAVISALTLIVNLFQSVRLGHFRLNCSDCCLLDTNSTGGDDDEPEGIEMMKKSDHIVSIKSSDL